MLRATGIGATPDTVEPLDRLKGTGAGADPIDCGPVVACGWDVVVATVLTAGGVLTTLRGAGAGSGDAPSARNGISMENAAALMKDTTRSEPHASPFPIGNSPILLRVVSRYADRRSTANPAVSEEISTFKSSPHNGYTISYRTTLMYYQTIDQISL